MAPRTIAIRTNGDDPVSPMRDDIARATDRRTSNTGSSGTSNIRSNRGSGRSLNTRNTSHSVVTQSRPFHQDMMMDPAEREALSRLGEQTELRSVPPPSVAVAPVRTTSASDVTTATAEETLTVITRSTSTSSRGTASSGTRRLKQSVKQYELELAQLKSKYEEAKTKMSRMKNEKSSNKKLLLEMSGLIKALQDISVDYEQTQKNTTATSNDTSSKDSSSTTSSQARHKAHLQNIQRKIQAIDTQMRAAKTQCGLLEEEKSLHTSTIKAQESQISALEDQIHLLVRRLEQSTKSNSHDQQELQKIIQLQENQILSLEGQISYLKRNTEHRRIHSMEQKNQVKYQEISNLEEKLSALREAQNAYKIQASVLRNMPHSQDSQDATSDDTPQPSQKVAVDAVPTEGELNDEIVEEIEGSEKPVAKINPIHPYGTSARHKKNKNVSFGKMNLATASLSAISEECEETESSVSLPEASTTTTSETTGGNTNATSSVYDDSSTDSISKEEDGSESSTTASSAPYSQSVASECDRKEGRDVSVEPSEDGSSVEILEASAARGVPERTAHKEDEPHGKGRSSHSTLEDSLDDIKETSEAINEDGEGASGNRQQRDNNYLLKELEYVTSKCSSLEEAYEDLVASTSKKLEELEQENQELRDCQNGLVLRTARTIDASASIAEIAKLKEENEILRRDVAQKEAKLSVSDTKYESLQREHAQTLLDLKGKAAQNDDLFSSDSNDTDEGVVDLETYNRLEKIHEAVVMKLADIGEDNDKLERERDAAKEELSSMYSKLQEHKGIALELEKLKKAFRSLEEERDATLSKLERMKDCNNVLQHNSEEMPLLRQKYADALARIEVVEKANEEFLDIEAKLTASEVRVYILESEIEKANENAKAAKRKAAERETQIREVIGQYKILKENYAQSQGRVRRLESVVESDKQIAAKANKRAGVSELSRTERTSTSADVSTTKVAAMIAQLSAYEGQINKLQTQRDAALEQMKELESELEKTKSGRAAALESKKTRERDLRIVLQHYEKLQNKYEATTKEFEEMARKYEETVQKIDVLEEQINANISFTDGGNKEIEPSSKINSQEEKSDVDAKKFETLEKSDEQPDQILLSNNEMDDDSSIDQLLHDMEDLKRSKEEHSNEGTVEEEKKDEEDDIISVLSTLKLITDDAPSCVEHDDLINQLKQAKESSTWKNEKIARVLCELKASQDQVEALEKESAQLQGDLNILKGHLLIAQKESANAKERLENREFNLRNAIAKHHSLQQSYESLEKKLEKVQDQLKAAQKESKVREEEVKAARKRASGVHAQFKSLKVDHAAVLDSFERLKQERDEIISPLNDFGVIRKGSSK